MEYHNVVIDFARRTQANLELVERSVAGGGEGYEITQLVNSLLGLLVFPQSHFFHHIPHKTLEELKKEGWPEVKVSDGFQTHRDLNELMRFLRNAVAHFNIEFIPDEHQNLCGIRVRNKREVIRDAVKIPITTWEASLSLEDLRTLVMKFIDLMIRQHEHEKRYR